MSQKMRVITINGWFDQDTPAEFNLPAWIMGVRAAGYILNNSTYVEGRYVVSVVVYDSDSPPAPPNQAPPVGTVLQ